MNLDEYIDIYDTELVKAFDEYMADRNPEMYYDDCMAEIYPDMYYEFCLNRMLGDSRLNTK